MSADFTIRQGDTKPIFTYTLTAADGTAVDLTGATVLFSMRKQPNYSYVTVPLAFVSGACTLVSAALGQIAYHWQPGDTATVGWYNAVFAVTFQDGTVETFPTGSFLTVEVTPAL